MKRRQLARIDLSNPDKPTLNFNSKSAFLSDLKDFKDGQRIWVEISSYSPKRSLNQNNTMYWWCDMIAKEIGLDEIDDVKELLQKKFLTVPLVDKHGNELYDENGVIEMTVLKMSKLNKVEMMDFLNKIDRWALDFLGMVLPQPEKQPELPLNNTPQINRDNL